MIKRADYDIVPTDMQMPVPDGVSEPLTIRCEERFKDLPAVAMTATSDDDRGAGRSRPIEDVCARLDALLQENDSAMPLPLMKVNHVRIAMIRMKMIEDVGAPSKALVSLNNKNSQ